MKSKITFISLFLLVSAFLLTIPKSRQIDVLLITVDTLRVDYLSCYDNTKIKTPHIDRLAARGLLFKKAFAQNVVTLPSHINILTGTYPFYHGVRDNAGFRLSEESLLISEVLKEKGYRTAAFIGAFPLDSRFGLTQGFDVYDDSYPSRNAIEYFYPEKKAEKVIGEAKKLVKG